MYGNNPKAICILTKLFMGGNTSGSLKQKYDLTCIQILMQFWPLYYVPFGWR